MCLKHCVVYWFPSRTAPARALQNVTETLYEQPFSLPWNTASLIFVLSASRHRVYTRRNVEVYWRLHVERFSLPFLFLQTLSLTLPAPPTPLNVTCSLFFLSPPSPLPCLSSSALIFIPIFASMNHTLTSAAWPVKYLLTIHYSYWLWHRNARLCSSSSGETTNSSWLF